ncbi:MAG TPA: glycosyltransferase family 39 protein [Candidatus Solibacter sp.]|nr:glycosyltransferase family 39 protein [Candidatus Solibacter sp.]
MTSGKLPNSGTVRRHPYVLFVLVAFAVRVARILIVHSYIIPLTHVLPPMSSGDPHFGFGFEIGSIAHSIVSGHGFGSPFGPITGPTAWIAPLYPYLSAAVFKMFGVFTPASAFVLLSLNSLFSALTCIPLYKICDRMMGRLGAALAAWTWALLPYFWSWPTSEIWETSLVALLPTYLVLTTLELADPANIQNGKRWLLYGLFWGISLLTNPVLLTFLPVAFIWLVYRASSQKTHVLRPATLALVACALVVMPWVVRNRIVFGQFVFIRSNFGFEFHLGNYHLSNGFGWAGKHPSLNKRELEQYATMGELAYIAAKRAEALQFVRQYPDEFLDLTLKRLSAFWSGAMMPYGGAPLLPWLYGPFSLVALFGWLLAARDKVQGQGLLLGLLLLYPLPFYIAFPQARNRYALEPEMLALSTYFFTVVLRRLFAKPKVLASSADCPLVTP